MKAKWEQSIRAQSRSAHGVRAIKLREGDFVVGATKIFDDQATILTVTDKGMGRRCAISSYREQNRGGLGLKNYPVSDEKGYVCGIRTLGPDDDVILISTDGVIIRFRANDLRIMGRPASGVRVMRLAEDSKVASFTRTAHDEDEETTEIEKVSDEEIAASLSEEASEVVEPDVEPNDDDDSDDNNGQEENPSDDE